METAKAVKRVTQEKLYAVASSLTCNTIAAPIALKYTVFLAWCTNTHVVVIKFT